MLHETDSERIEIPDVAAAIKILDEQSLPPIAIAALRLVSTASKYGDPDAYLVDEGLEWLAMQAEERQRVQLEQSAKTPVEVLAPPNTPVGIIQRRLIFLKGDRDSVIAEFAGEMFDDMQSRLGLDGLPNTKMDDKEIVIAQIRRQGDTSFEDSLGFMRGLEFVHITPSNRVMRMPPGHIRRRVGLTERIYSQPDSRDFGDIIGMKGSGRFTMQGVSGAVALVEREEIMDKHARSAYSHTPGKNLRIALVIENPKVQ